MANLSFLKKYSEKIQRSKNRVNRFWDFESDDRNPIIIFKYPNYNLSQELLVDWDKYLTDKELSLQVKLEAIKEHLEFIDDDYIPYIDIFMGTPLVASAFGCEVEFFKDKDPWVRGAVINDYKEIDKITVPDLKRKGLTKETIDLIEYYKSATNGKLPISLPDIQGPLSVAIDLMGAEKVYMGFHDDPKRMRDLLDIISEAIVKFINIILKKIDDNEYIFDWLGIYGPREKRGIRISEDNIISISEGLYKEFIEPVHIRIIDEINGGIIHWCGNGRHNFNNIARIEKITGIHNSSMGDASIIREQMEELNLLYKKDNKEVFYFNCLGLPCSKDDIDDLIKDSKKYKGTLINTGVPIDDFGISYNYKKDKFGYKKFKEDPLEILKELLRKNNQ